MDTPTSTPPQQPTTGRLLSKRSLAFGGGLLLLGLLAAAGAQSYRDLAAIRQREAALNDRLRETRQRISDLERRVDRLRHDPATLERHAREELGMVKPGDVVIVLPSAP